MDFKGTKGEWKYYKSIDNTSYTVSTINGLGLFYTCYNSNPSQIQYNALLISKAPEMLKEIEESIIDLLCIQGNIYDACKTDTRWKGVYEILQKQIDRKKILIKQATEL